MSTKVDTHQEQLMPFHQIVEICRRRGGSGCGGVSRMDAATELTWTYLQRPPQPDPPRHPSAGPLLLLLLRLPASGRHYPRVPGATRAETPALHSGSWVVCLIRCIGISVLVFCTPAIRFRCCIWNCR
ncbi:hypothetical protein D7Y57_13800 [Stenotrophomonas maltophilia]|nr:hypothetical protein [Stenotrophomonas maltophilia]